MDILLFMYLLQLGFQLAPVFGRFVQETARREKEYTKSYKNTEHTNRKQKYKPRKRIYK